MKREEGERRERGEGGEGGEGRGGRGKRREREEEGESRGGIGERKGKRKGKRWIDLMMKPSGRSVNGKAKRLSLGSPHSAQRAVALSLV